MHFRDIGCVPAGSWAQADFMECGGVLLSELLMTACAQPLLLGELEPEISDDYYVPVTKNPLVCFLAIDGDPDLTVQIFHGVTLGSFSKDGVLARNVRAVETDIAIQVFSKRCLGLFDGYFETGETAICNDQRCNIPVFLFVCRFVFSLVTCCLCSHFFAFRCSYDGVSLFWSEANRAGHANIVP